MSVSGFHYGFCIGKYKDVYAMEDDVAKEFLRQFRVFLWQKEATANKYRILGWTHNNIGVGILDEEDGYSEFKGCNDSKGNDFIRSIIDQRNDLIAQYDNSLRSALEEEERADQRKKDAIRETHEWALAQTEKRERKREEEAFQKRNRMDAANIMIRIEYKKQKQIEKQQKENKEWEAIAKKVFAKKKKNTK
jgi:hypothetical protein